MKKLIFGLVLFSAFIQNSYASLLTPQRPSDIQAASLKGYWKCDEASGNRSDSSGNSYTLTDNNTVTAVADNYWDTENSCDFESGNAESLSRANASAGNLNFTGSYSFAAWIKPESFPNPAWLVSMSNDSSTGWAIQLNTSGQLRFSHNGTEVLTSTALSTAKWHHVGFTYDTTNNVGAIYIDGLVDVTGAMTTDPATTAADFVLGALGTDEYDGLMKDAAAWSTVLTPEEIYSLARGVQSTEILHPNSSTLTAPTGYWKMNEISDTTNAKTRVDTMGNHNLTDNSTCNTLGGYHTGAGADLASCYFTTADSANFDMGTGDYSIVMWVKYDTVVNGHYLYSHGATPNIGLRYTGGYIIYEEGAAKISNGTTVTTGVWYCVAVVRRSGNLYLYLDGVELQTVADSTDITGGATTFSLGGFNDGSNLHDGLIGETAFWKGYGLTAAEVKSLAAAVPIQQTGFISYYKLDETSGNATDSYGSNTLTDTNTVGTGTGKVTNGRDFEAGSSEYFVITDGSQTGLDLTSDFTLLYWLNAETASDNRIINKEIATAGYGSYLTAGGAGSTVIANSATSNTTAFTVGTFGHFGGTFEGANRRAYFNGTLQATTASTTAPADNTDSFRLGASSTPSLYLDGILDEVLVAKRWFRNEEIKAAYLKGLSGKELTSTEVQDGRRRIIVTTGG